MKRLAAVLLALGLILVAAGLARAQTTTGEGEEAEYRLGPEDVVQIQVWNRADLTGPVVVDFAGKLQLPLVGEVDAQGRTLEELSPLLTERYRLMDPSITEVMVGVAQYNSRSVTVVGEVHNPGRFGFRSIPDLWSVILNAGGATPDADLGRVQIVRGGAGEGGLNTVPVDLSRGVEKTPKEGLPALEPKDTILIPSLIGNVVTGDKFQVLGAVRMPGTYRLSAAASVLEAISVSGGGLPNADLSHVRLTRAAARGALSYTLDVQGYLDAARPAADIELKPGDTVTVPAKRSLLDTVMNGMARLVPVLSVAVSLTLASR
jgi:polysaccharide export outer membrane protein